MPLLRESVTKLLFHHGAHWFKDVLRILRLIWLEVTGTIFFGLAAFGIPSAIREWRLMQQGGSLLRFASTVLFIGTMAAFGVYSFYRARRFRRP
jgi:hypothetical protein